MTLPKRLYTNCPVCRTSVTTRRGSIRVPRHGHIKARGRWLPPCIGSGAMVRP